nr:hypothetical protein [Sutcliffiella rhizosphaerae]
MNEEGEYVKHKLGLNIDKGEQPQALVTKNTIFWIIC